MFCNNCGAENTDNAHFCGNCGKSLAGGSARPSSEYKSGRVSDNKEDIQEYYAEAIGYKKADYYLSRFDRFDLQGVGVSWNWPAFFVSFYWLLYRKMWVWALLYFLLPIPLAIVEAILLPVSEAAVGLVYVVYLAGVFILLPMYANALYYRHLNKKIERAKSFSNDKEKRLRMVAAEGGTSSVALIVVLIFVFIAIIGILAAIAIPAYQDYVTRAKVAEGLSYGGEYKSKVEEYAIQNQQWPQSIADIGGAGKMVGSNVGDVSIDNGVVLIRYVGGAIDGKSIALIPSVNDESYIVWECKGIDIENRYLPASCRN